MKTKEKPSNNTLLIITLIVFLSLVTIVSHFIYYIEDYIDTPSSTTVSIVLDPISIEIVRDAMSSWAFDNYIEKPKYFEQNDTSILVCIENLLFHHQLLI